jgi:flagellar protein FlaG
MVQNIRPPQSAYSPDRQLETAAKPAHGDSGRVEPEPRTPGPISPPTKGDLEQAAARIKDVLRGSTSHLEIEIDHDLKRAVVKVLNGESGEIIRQIPAQELLDLAKHLDVSKGLLVRERV